MNTAAVVARIREAEDRLYQLIDELVDTALAEPGTEVWSGVISEQWKTWDKKSWHTKSYATQWLAKWLRAAEERGELESELRPWENLGISRRYSWRPKSWRS